MNKSTFEEQLAKNGKLIYTNKGDSKKLVIDEKEARIVRDIYECFISGYGTQRTTEYINQKYNIDKPLAISTVRYILTNEKYIGDTLYQKTYTPDVLGSTSRKNNGEKEQYYIKGTHQAIIDEETFYIAQQLLNKRKIAISSPKKFDFTNKIFCGNCGGKYMVRDYGEIRKWVCIRHITKAEMCPSSQIREDIVESAFISLFNIILSQKTVLLEPVKNSLQELEIKQAVGNTNVIELRRNILQLKEQLRVIAELRTKGFIIEAKCNEQTAEINARINKLTKDLRLLSKNSDDTLKDIEMLIDYFEKREHIMIDFEAEVFEFLVDKIVVDGNKLEFHIMGGLKFTEEI